MSELTAGRELDVLIAEKVMGLVPCKAECHTRERSPLPGPCHAQPDSPDQGGETKEYSTDIAAAWTVVEKLREGKYEFTLFNDSDKTGEIWRVYFGPTDSLLEDALLPAVDADTAPLAICRAALCAVGVA
jgi:hypothetical protein